MGRNSFALTSIRAAPSEGRKSGRGSLIEIVECRDVKVIGLTVGHAQRSVVKSDSDSGEQVTTILVE